MPIDLSLIDTEEGRLPREAIVNGDGTPTIAYLDALRSSSIPALNAYVGRILTEFGLESEISCKGSRTAIDKCLRPAILEKYPWFNLSHIRDYLRFRTRLYKMSDFEDMLHFFDRLQNRGDISIVKIDMKKLLRPGVFGWRMLATDIRLSSSGMLIEHYMTFREMIDANERWLHRVYETWRSAAPDSLTMEDMLRYEEDACLSRHAYRELMFDGILRGAPAGSSALAQRKSADRAVLDVLASTLSRR